MGPARALPAAWDQRRRNAVRLEDELPPELDDEPPPPPPPPDDELDEPPPLDELEEELEDEELDELDELELDEELEDDEEDDDELDDDVDDDELLDGFDDVDDVDDDEPVGDVGLSLVVQPDSSPTPASATPPESNRRNWRRSALRASAAPSAFRETQSVMYGLLTNSKTALASAWLPPSGRGY